MKTVSIGLCKKGDSFRAYAYNENGTIAQANCDTKEHALRALADNLADVLDVETTLEEDGLDKNADGKESSCRANQSN